jgi:hypothetical protein
MDELNPLRPLEFTPIPDDTATNADADSASEGTPSLRRRAVYNMQYILPGTLNGGGGAGGGGGGDGDDGDDGDNLTESMPIEVIISATDPTLAPALDSYKPEMQWEPSFGGNGDTASDMGETGIGGEVVAIESELPAAMNFDDTQLIIIDVYLTEQGQRRLQHSRLNFLIDPTIAANIGHRYQLHFNHEKIELSVTKQRGDIRAILHSNKQKTVTDEAVATNHKFIIHTNGISLTIWGEDPAGSVYALSGTLNLGATSPHTEAGGTVVQT